MAHSASKRRSRSGTAFDPKKPHTPSNDPYLGLESVHHFDQVIISAMAEQHRIGPWTRRHQLTPLQRAVSQLMPSACSIALSIREMVRQGYLLSALILTRPLLERVSTVVFLMQHPEAVKLWNDGWPHNSRPSIRKRLDAVLGRANGRPDRPTTEELQVVIDRYNSLVHGDPAAALHGAILLDDGRPGYTVGKDLKSPGGADEICWETGMWLVILETCGRSIFRATEDSTN